MSDRTLFTKPTLICWTVVCSCTSILRRAAARSFDSTIIARWRYCLISSRCASVNCRIQLAYSQRMKYFQSSQSSNFSAKMLSKSKLYDSKPLTQLSVPTIYSGTSGLIWSIPENRKVKTDSNSSRNMVHFITIHHYLTKHWLSQSRWHTITELVWSSYCRSF